MTIHSDAAAAIAGAGSAGVSIRHGIIDSVEAGGTLAVKIGGSDTAVGGLKYLSGFTPAAGQRVALLLDRGDCLVLGRILP